MFQVRRNPCLSAQAGTDTKGGQSVATAPRRRNPHLEGQGKAMNKQLAAIQEALARAMQALESLEAAIDAGDNRKIGACLYELRQALKEADREAHQTTGR